MKKVRTLAVLLFAAGLFLMLIPFNGFAKNKIVYVVPIEETVEKGLYAFLKRSVSEAEEAGADAVIFEVNSPGGAVDAAAEIGKLLSSAKVKTIAFINNKALSAGAYISLNADEIYMVPGATIGSAAVIDQNGNAAGKKAESYWFAAMQSAAKINGRDPIYALAMADEKIELPQYGDGKDDLLTLTSDQAIEAGYAEGIVKNLDELLKVLGLDQADIRTINESFAEKVARFITHPIVIPILLTVGSLGLVVELFSPGFGLPGFIGLSTLLLFFYGHLVAGLAGYETIILFVIGVGLILLEFFIAGGIAGILGFVLIIASLFLSAENAVHMGISLLIAIGVSILAFILLVKVFGKKIRLFRKIILTDSTSTEKGYVSNKSRPELIGLEGYALTALRPAGTIVINNERLDVVSEGSFIQKNTRVRVIKAEGPRIVVREIPDLKNED
ncbi:hypothetical protein PB1_15234 [Bacillus methanolicus PB1]|uniref:Uncharacterized protein n=1 Tax=Bacillus methanolicus PB1 TaxID=997296 RepID=I3DXF2_BACMT|nr:nodulation protein NfeD [Bacillus methanolicus]EIJ78923.1 hypothetical protein PB1_15234 [Bacillus methanolicus PB1]